MLRRFDHYFMYHLCAFIYERTLAENDNSVDMVYTFRLIHLADKDDGTVDS
jgi:hypothetical protein